MACLLCVLGPQSKGCYQEQGWDASDRGDSFTGGHGAEWGRWVLESGCLGSSISHNQLHDAGTLSPLRMRVLVAKREVPGGLTCDPGIRSQGGNRGEVVSTRTARGKHSVNGRSFYLLFINTC